MNDTQFDGLSERVMRVETQMKDVREDVRDLRIQDIRDIKLELRQLHDEFSGSQKGMSRTEKMMFSGIVIAAIGAIAAVIGILSQGPGA